jgi:hypothetical protein
MYPSIPLLLQSKRLWWQPAPAFERLSPVPNSLLALCGSTFYHLSNDALALPWRPFSTWTLGELGLQHVVHFERIGGAPAWLPESQDLFTVRGCDAMKPEKEFDCVEMKTASQAQLLSEVAELGEDEAQSRRAERLSSDPILGGFLRAKMAVGKDSVESTPVA